MLKKVISTILSLSLAMTLLSLGAFALGTLPSVTVAATASTLTAQPGESVNITISLTNPSDICSLSGKFTYDSTNLEVDGSPTNGVITMSSTNTEIVGEVSFSWFNVTDIAVNGALITIPIKVKESATANTYNITPSDFEIEEVDNGNTPSKNLSQ